MNTQEHEGPLAVPPGDVLGTYIMLRNWPKAIEEVSARLGQARTARKRGFYHLFLATLYKMVVKGAKRRRETEKVEEYRGKAEAAYLTALEEDPHNINTKLSLAEFYLRHQGNAAAALNTLQPFGDQDHSSQLSIVQQEHRRRALLGAAYAMQGRTDEARKWLMEAYADESFQTQLSYSYNTVFWTLILHGVKLPVAVLDEVLEQLKAYQNYRPKNIVRFRAELAAPEA